jgi:multicomponent Na+:H+ antiporter subunit G
MEFIGVGLLWFGVVFCALGVLGLVRMPDVYTRLHASGKVATVGLFGTMAGAAFLMPPLTLKVVALILFVILTLPISSHAIALAAHRRGIPMKNAVRDDLARFQGKEVPQDSE